MPQNLFFGAWKGVFKQNMQNILTSYYQNYMMKATAAIPTKFCTVLFVDSPKMRSTNPRSRTAAIMKSEKSRYLQNRSANFDEILHDDAY